MRDDGDEVVDVALMTTLITFYGEVDGVGDVGGIGISIEQVKVIHCEWEINDYILETGNRGNTKTDL